jgi:hypothetical protein
MNLAKPARKIGTGFVLDHWETGTGIALLHWYSGSSADPFDTENYDILLSMVIKSQRRVMQCNHKLAGKGYDRITEFAPSPWFSEKPQLSVDITDDQFEIYIDGRKVQSYSRSIKKSVTHVHYYCTPSRAGPLMAREITARVN